MQKGVMGFLFLMVLFGTVSAEVSLPPWSWNTYSGTQAWQVTITEDQSGCDGPVLTNRYPVSINFSAGTAEMGDVGHGPAPGTFISGNILHMAGRTVDDPPGKSTLSAYDIFFTTDCSAFAGKYRWDYTGPDGSCSGTTSLAGTNSQGCPASQAAPVVPSVPPASGEAVAGMLAGARYDLTRVLDLRDLRSNQEAAIISSEIRGQGDSADVSRMRELVAQETAQINALEPKVEDQYAAILAKDPASFEANMDIAQLKKSQGKLDEFADSVDKALSDERIAEARREEVRKDIVRRNNLGELPTPDRSFFIQRLGPDVRTAAQNVYGINLEQKSTSPSALDSLKYLVTYEGAKNAVTTLVFGGDGS